MKVFYLLLSFVFLLLGNHQAEAWNINSKIMKEQRILVVYYSWSGNTEAVARKIQAEMNAAIFKIELQQPYPTDYAACVDEYRRDKSEGNIRLLKKTLEDTSYDVIFIGTPIWSGTMAPPIRTFLSGHNLEGKRIIPFATHGGGGSGSCFQDMKKIAPKAVFSEGLSLYGKRSGFEKEVEKWLKKLDIKTLIQ